MGPHPASLTHLRRPWLVPVVSLVAWATVSATGATAEPHGSPQGTWTPHGVEVCRIAGSQVVPAIASDGSGGAFITWEDSRSGTGADIYVQRLDELGQPLWMQNGALVTTAAGNQGAPVVISDGLGGAYVAWEEQSTTPSRVYLQRLDPNGAPRPGWPIGGIWLFDQNTAAMSRPKLATDGLGGAYVLAQRPGGIYMQLIAPDGTLHAGWSGSGKQVRTGTLARPQLASDGLGGAWVIWTEARTIENTTSYSDPWRRYVPDATTAASGTFVGPSYPGLATHSTGSAIIVAADFTTLRMERLLSNGGVAWTRVLGATVAGPSCAVVSDGLGGAYVAWTPTFNSTTTDLLASYCTANGTLATGWNDGGNAFCGSQPARQEPRMVPDGLGQAIAIWDDARFGDRDLFMSVLGTHGIQPGIPFGGVLLSGMPGDQTTASAAQTGPGAAIVTWADTRNSDTGADIYAQRVTTDLPTAVLVSDFIASVDDRLVTLHWHVVSNPPAQMSVWRKGVRDAIWSLLGAASQGTGGFSFEDDDVPPGGYFYRVAADGDGPSAELSVDVIGSAPLGIRIPGPNPSTGDIRLEVSLAVNREARVECVDLSGRLMWFESVRNPRATESFVLRTQGWPAGVYWIRATQGPTSKTARVALVR